MSTIYLARRTVYPNTVVNAGFFDNYEAAQLSAADSLFPELAAVEAIDIGAVLPRYVPFSSYPDTIQQCKTTYYCFSDDIAQTLSLRPSLKSKAKIELAIEHVIDEWLYNSDIASSMPEFILIAGLQSRIDDSFEGVFVLDEQHYGEVEFGVLAGAFTHVARGRGFSDRRRLIELAEIGAAVHLSASLWSDPGDWEDELAQNLAEQFWEYFIVDDTEPPDPSFDNWEPRMVFP